MEVGLSLGSNISNRLDNLKEAKRRLLDHEDVRLMAQSPVYETEPIGVKPEYQNLMFLNAVVILESPCSVHECFDKMRAIEDDMGRHRSLDRFAPRAIDIDMIYAGDLLIASGGLVIPHAHWRERRFVVQPLADVRPDLRLPGCAQTVREVLAALADNTDVTLYQRDW